LPVGFSAATSARLPTDTAPVARAANNGLLT
jgi:hypothetical protein